MRLFPAALIQFCYRLPWVHGAYYAQLNTKSNSGLHIFVDTRIQACIIHSTPAKAGATTTVTRNQHESHQRTGLIRRPLRILVVRSKRGFTQTHIGAQSDNHSKGRYTMTTLIQASHQWATRPSDQRFTSLTELDDFCQSQRLRSTGKAISSRAISAAPVDVDSKALMIVGPDGEPVIVTNWSFGQLAQRAGAPAGYMRDLPAPLAADCLNYGLHHHRDIEDLGVLLYKNRGLPELRAVTGPNYGRIWNSTLTRVLKDRFGDGVSGHWRVPGEFGKRITVTKANTTLYASDRDMFVFLADEDRRIEMPNRRDGKSGSLARGVFFWNSEVGSTTLGMAGFLFDYTCSNRTVWGVEGYQELRIRHTAGAPDRWIENAMPAIEAYANQGTESLQKALQAAQAKKVDAIDEFLAKRFTKSQVGAIKAAHMADEQRPIETLWDAATGVTAYARNIQFQDQRVAMEREAGKILNLAQ